MRGTKFSLHFAVGAGGEFGMNGRLPWGSYPSELEFFWESLSLESGRIVVIGLNTWRSLPKAVQRRFDELLGGNLIVLSSERTLEETILTFPEGVHYACVGGADLLERVMETQEVDKIYMSVMYAEETYLADTFIDLELVNMVRDSLELLDEHIHEPVDNFTAVSFIYGETH